MSAGIEDAKADYLAAKDAIGRTDAKILFVRRFKIEGKSEGKNEHKILAITSCRIYLITKKSPGSKVDLSFHILELHSLDSSKPLKLNVAINIGEKQYLHSLLFANQDDIDKTIAYATALLKTNFVNADVHKQVVVKVESEEKKKLISQQTQLIVQSLSGEGQPCGSFSIAYMCMCDYYNQVSLAEVIWDINKIYSSHDCKNFLLEDFDHLEAKELVPLVASLAYNTWFTCLTISSYKLTNELVDAVIRAIKRSSSLEEIRITEAHLNKDQVLRLSLALCSNPNKVVKIIDLSKNTVEDKGITSLAGCLGAMPYGVESLCIAETGLTSKGAGILSNALKNNRFMSSSLVKLDLSGNSLKSDGLQSLCDFLAQPNALETLNLSHTDSALDLLFGALLRGCLVNLQNLLLSGNPFSYKKPKDSHGLPSFQQFFSSCRALKSVDLSYTKIPSSAVKAVFIGLLNNPVVSNIHLDLSRNELKSAGASEICSCIKDVRCISSLNLADNGLDQDLVPLCEAIEESQSIRELDLSRNVSKSKYNSAISEAMADMIMSESLRLEKVSIADCKLRLDAAALFDCIGTDETLTSFDISGNGIGDTGARLIAKALQINTKLKEIRLDRNGITHKGLQDIALAMERNFSLHSIPLPMADLTASLKHNGEAFTKYYRQIEVSLIRNQSVIESSPDQSYKVHQGLLITSIDTYTQFTDRLVVDLQDLVSEHKNSTNEEIKAELKTAKNLIKETDSFRQVLLELYSDFEASKKSLDDKFSSIATDLSETVEQVLKGNVDKMLNIARKICPTALNDEGQLGLIKQELVEVGLIDKASIFTSLTQCGKADIMYQLCESNLSTASSVGDHLKKVLVNALEGSINRLKSLPDKVFANKAPTTENNEVEEKSDEGSQEVETTGEQEDGNAAEVLQVPKDEEEEKESQATFEEMELKKKEVEAENVDVETTEVEEEEDKNKKEFVSGGPLSPISPGITVSTPARKLLSEIIKDESFDMPWEFTSGSRLSTMMTEEDDDDDSTMAATKARTRLSTLAQSEAAADRHRKKKKASIKRRPTFYREVEKPAEEVEISFETQSPTDKSSSISKKTEITKDLPDNNADTIDAPQPREHLPSVGAFDAVSTSASPLAVKKDRIKPATGRRAPSRVSHLAHMNPQNTEKFMEEEAQKAPPVVTPNRPPRPVSAMPAMSSNVDSSLSVKSPQRTASEKVKPKVDKANKQEKKSDSKKEKKKPVGGIQLPSLPGFLKRKDRSSSKVESNDEPKAAVVEAPAPDIVDAKPKEKTMLQNVPEKEESKPAEVADKKEPDESPPPAQKLSVDKPPVEAPKPERPKRPLVPKVGVPMVGGSALLAEMKKRQTKGDDNKSLPVPAAKPKPEPSSKRSGSISKPPPPKRPQSIKKSNDEGKPVITERPKPVQRPKQTEQPKVDDSETLEGKNEETPPQVIDEPSTDESKTDKIEEVKNVEDERKEENDESAGNESETPDKPSSTNPEKLIDFI